jgi:hypothetical protein
MNECASCSRLFSEFCDIHAIQLAQAPASATNRDDEREARLKASILRAAQRENTPLSEVSVSPFEYETWDMKPVGWNWVIRGRRSVIGLCLVGSCFALALAFIWTRKFYVPPANPQIATSRLVSRPVTGIQGPSHRDEAVLRTRVASLEAERSRRDQLLRESETENTKLVDRNSEAEQQLGILSEELESARAAERLARQRLDQMVIERASDQSAMAAQNREIRSLNDKLDEQTTNGDTAKNVVDAERDLRELVEARNLHIRDVYDTDPSGKTNKAVGRIFFTEGKSLVFYAYDLSTNQPASDKYAYYVWGNKDGNLEAVRNLGVLGADDPQQKRWKLQVSDAKVLADIDRVFVTVESVGKLGPRPRGKKILNAYLGGPPNHP